MSSPSSTTWWPGRRSKPWLIYLLGGSLLAAAALGFWAITNTSLTMTGNRRVSILIVRVTDPQGRPVVGARGYFTAGPEPLPEIAALTDQHGQFSLSAPAAGTYQLGCTAENFVPATVTVRVPRDAPPAPVEIRLHR